MPVVGHFDPKSLLATPMSVEDGFEMDFTTITMEELKDFVVPLEWHAQYTGLMHGVAGWFTLQFSGNPANEHASPIELSTAPHADKTHWQQVRFLFREPLAVNSGQIIRGWMHCVVNEMRSYTVDIEVIAGPFGNLSDPHVEYRAKNKLQEKERKAGQSEGEDETEEASNQNHGTSDSADGKESGQIEGETEQDDEQLAFVRRKGRWELHEQSYNYSYTGPQNDLLTKPEHLCMYEPDANMAYESTAFS
ncbi:Histone-arginine methyltransferase carm1, partial [Actinomortierella wolfii]